MCAKLFKSVAVSLMESFGGNAQIFTETLSQFLVPWSVDKDYVVKLFPGKLNFAITYLLFIT